MLKNLNIYLSCLVICSFTCLANETDQQPKNEAILDNQYTCKQIGWKMPIPQGFSIMADALAEKFAETGAKAISDTAGEEVSTDELVNLLHYHKGRFAIFQSSIEPFKVDYEGEWSENNIMIKELLIETMKQQGISAKASETTRERIDGVEFEVFEVSLFAPTGNLVAKQLLYSSLINGFDFGVSINYIKDEDRDTMLHNFRKSTFSK